MRKIEKEMINAIDNGKEYSKDNTVVGYDKNGYLFVNLHGNTIIFDTSQGFYINNCGWDSVTTKSRLNAFLDYLANSKRIYQKNYRWYLHTKTGDIPIKNGTSYPV